MEEKSFTVSLKHYVYLFSKKKFKITLPGYFSHFKQKIHKTYIYILRPSD
jgi:hypothetical protein